MIGTLDSYNKNSKETHKNETYKIQESHNAR